MRIVFAGTPDFAVPALDALVEAGHELAAVYTQPDRPAGRGRKLAPSPVKQRALELGIPVEQPDSLKPGERHQKLASYSPDVMVVVAYGLLLPQAVLDIPTYGCLNIHASLLPRWRGAAPIQRAIAAGDHESGVGIMQMERGLDTGPVLLERRITLEPGETGGSLHDRLSAIGAEAIVAALASLEGGLIPQPQAHDKATYAHKLSKDEARIDWRRSALEIERMIRAFNPWPVAFIPFKGAPLRVWEAKVLPDENQAAQPGVVLAASADGIDIATGDGILRLVRLQPAGKRAMNAGEFLNGHRVDVGARLEG